MSPLWPKVLCLLLAHGVTWIPHCSGQSKVSTCPRPDYQWMNDLNRCVKLHTQKADWDTARKACSQDRAVLWRPVTYHAFLRFQMVFPHAPPVWMGLSDKGKEGQWVWTNGNSTQYTAWFWPNPTNPPIEPNGGTLENCVLANRSFWYDQPCSHRASFVCQIDPSTYIDECASKTHNCSADATCKLNATSYTCTCLPGYHGDGHSCRASVPCRQSNYLWISQLKRCVRLYQVQTTWTAASKACTQDNGQLIKIESTADVNAVKSFVPSDMYSHDIWIGLNDRQQEGEWNWTDGENVNYTNWMLSQPIPEPNGRDTENCVVASSSSGLWSDYPCGSQFSYMCEQICTGTVANGTVAINGSVTCDTKYVYFAPVGGRRPICDAKGQWTNVGTCEVCTGTVANGAVAPNGSVTCDTNFVYIAPVGVRRPICNAQRQWTNVGTCEDQSRYCAAAPSSVANGKVHRTGNLPLKINDIFHVECNPGHSANGDGMHSWFTVTCRSNGHNPGHWSGLKDCAFPCPTPYHWDAVLKKCITVVTGSFTGNGAQDKCHQMSGSLIRIKNVVENNHTWQLVGEGFSWIGLRNVDTMDWVWQLQHGYYESSHEYRQWEAGYPKSTVDGRCAVMTAVFGGSWGQTGCGQFSTSSSRFVCERVACWYKDYIYDHQLARCVKVYEDTATWTRASQVCAQHQANLIRISTPDEEQRVNYFDLGKVWLGLTKFGNSYYWRQGSSSVPFNQLYNGSSSNWNYGVDTCVTINGVVSDQWSVLNCRGTSSLVRFVCQTTDCPLGHSYSKELGRCREDATRFLQSGSCARSDYKYIGTIFKCVKFVKIPASWYWAERACRLDGGVLMRPLNSATEQEIQGNVPNQLTWIGLNDLETEGTFKYVNQTGRESGHIALGSYVNWVQGEANGKTGENCVVTSNSGWMDYPCHDKFPYSCQL